MFRFFEECNENTLERMDLLVTAKLNFTTREASFFGGAPVQLNKGRAVSRHEFVSDLWRDKRWLPSWLYVLGKIVPEQGFEPPVCLVLREASSRRTGEHANRRKFVEIKVKFKGGGGRGVSMGRWGDGAWSGARGAKSRAKSSSKPRNASE